MYTCTSCKRREAVILRSHSGEKLCSLCAWKSLRKGIARSLAKPGILRAGEKMLLAVPGWRPSTGLLCARVLPSIEEKHGGTLSVLAPEPLKQHFTGQKGDTNVHTYNPLPKGSPSELLLQLIEAALEVAVRENYTSIALATLAIDHVKAGLDSLLSGRPELLPRLQPWAPGPPSIVSCLWKVEAEFALQMTYLAGLHLIDPVSVQEPGPAGVLLQEVVPGSPELQFSSLQGLQGIAYILQKTYDQNGSSSLGTEGLNKP